MISKYFSERGVYLSILYDFCQFNSNRIPIKVNLPLKTLLDM